MSPSKNPYRSRSFPRDRRVWAITLVVLAAAWGGTVLWLNRRIEPSPRRAAAPGESTRLVALAWDRLVPEPDGKYLDRESFGKQIQALREAGYQPVTLAEVEAFYRDRAALPAKPVVLTFDEGYLSTYEAADPVLREHRWPGVMFLRTDRQERRDVSFLFWDRLARMVESGIWEVATGDPPEGAGSAGGASPPGAVTIEGRLPGARVRAWAPRGAASAEVPPGAGRWLEFRDDPVGANGAATLPRRLRRLRVPAAWSAEELVRRVDIAVAGAGEGAPQAAAWVPGEGVARADGERIALEGAPRGEAWLPATEWTEGFVLEATVERRTGEIWIVQPSEEPGREWRVGGDETGLYLEARSAGRPPEVLARSNRGIAAGAPHRLRLVRRGPGVAVTWDGEPLSPAPVALAARWRGKLGIVVYAAGSRARSSVSHVALAALPFRSWPIPAQLSAEDVQLLAAAAERIAAVGPPWGVLENGALSERPFDSSLLAILARRYAWDVVPRVEARGAPPAGTAWAMDLADRVERAGWPGIDVTPPGPAMDASWAAGLSTLDAALGRSGRRLLVAGVPREEVR